MASKSALGRDLEQGQGKSCVPHSIRPGDVLADRYRLVDLLTESGSGRFWRAHDRVLQRHVALHVIAADDERAAGLLEAARMSATVLDRRLLRVLDADQSNGVTFVVNEWGSGRSLDIMLANEGPLAARRAAWLVSEVAAAMAVAHDAGVAHGRLVPENVLVDRAGSVRVIGFSVDAALNGLPPGRIATDVADLGGLLYAALTGKWPGVSRSKVPPAPEEHGRVLRPRQVRAGIPRPLDVLCDEVVNPYAGSHPRQGHDLGTARGISDYLSQFVGDPTGMAEAEAAGVAASQRGDSTVVMPRSPGRRTPVAHHPGRAPEVEDEINTDPDTEPDTAPETEPDTTPETEPDAPPGTDRVPAEQPTQAGLPIFDDITDDVSWLARRPTPPPPPPPFEEPPERPLFAPAPVAGQPVRRPRPQSATSTGGSGYWPWDTGGDPGDTGGAGTPVPVIEDEDDEVPGRRWLRLAAVIGASLVLLLAVVVAFNLGRGRTPLGAEPEPDPGPTRTPTPSGAPAPISGVTARDFDPEGDPPEENRELAPLAVDGDPATSWRTMTYDQNFGPGGLKNGAGLLLDLGRVRDVSAADLVLVGNPTELSLYVTRRAPTSVDGLDAAATVDARTRARVTLDEPASGRFVTVWLTSIPTVDGGFRGEIAEVTVRG
jgi:serine/threonine protein kinase